MYSKIISAAFVASIFAGANAHMKIQAPSPIPGSAIKDPLDASGDNFPCHSADLTQGTVTPMAVGSVQPLQFDLGGGANTAVHGGGSCQISLTYETDATAQKDPANWHVIQSFVGGCPTNAIGNLDNAVACPENDPACVNNFSFTIPPEVQNGNAILGWTWFNNVGNREMYMNCAKVSITGGSNQLSSLAALTVANLASINTCATTENFNTEFPNPGKYVTQASTLNYPLKLATGSGCGTGSGSTGSTTGGSDSAAAAPAAGSGTAVAGTPAASIAAVPVASGTAGVFAPGAAGAVSSGVAASVPLATPTATSIATTFVTAASPVATPASTGSTGSSTNLVCTAGQVTCTASGFYCISATQFGMCAWGCATPMDMSAGTQCTNGAVSAVVSARRGRRAIPERRHVSPLF